MGAELPDERSAALLVLTVQPCAGKQFGDVLVDVGAKAVAAGATVAATFVSACPRNHLRTGDTFLAVQRFMADGSWETVGSFILCLFPGARLWGMYGI